MKVISLVFSFLVLASVSAHAQTNSKKQVKKYKVVAVVFDESDIQRHANRMPASEVEQAEMQAQARLSARVNRDDWGSLD